MKKNYGFEIMKLFSFRIQVGELIFSKKEIQGSFVEFFGSTFFTNSYSSCQLTQVVSNMCFIRKEFKV